VDASSELLKQVQDIEVGKSYLLGSVFIGRKKRIPTKVLRYKYAINTYVSNWMRGVAVRWQ
jgi:hypothetical protein